MFRELVLLLDPVSPVVASLQPTGTSVADTEFIIFNVRKISGG